MIGAVQLGVLAASIVILVPMGLAGWHLSRNKMLFFSGALFISLAVAVHLSPYFPSLSDFLPAATTTASLSSSSSAVVVVQNRHSCLPLLHHIDWSGSNSNSTRSELSWSWARSDPRVLSCDFQRLRKPDARDLLNGSWVVIAGDSQARLFTLSLLNLILDEDQMESVHEDLFKRHSDYRIVVDRIGLKLDFIWAPYATNLTRFMMDLNRNKQFPDVLVMGSGLWHMLHVTNATDYGLQLQLLSKTSMSSLLPISPEIGAGLDPGSLSGRTQPHLFWLGLPVLINSMLNTEEKREKMTSFTQDAYNYRLRHGSNLLRDSDGQFLLLDVGSLSGNCGVGCTEDGMHYDGLVYEAAVQIMLNALLIESEQKL